VSRLLSVVLLLAAAPAARADLRFVVVGHLRGGPGNGAVPRERIRELVAEVNRAEPDLVFVLGDLVYGSWHEVPDADAIRADWDAVDAELDAIAAEVHYVPGNHDAWDPVTRDIWLERYGPMYGSFEREGCLFLLLRSGWVPAAGDDSWCPGKYTRGAPLEPEQVEFARARLEGAGAAEHVFVMMHHVLWWEQPEQWWSELHPLLASAPTRAVFAGDLGPWKFSHEERDGIQYVQTTVEFTTPPIEMLRNREESRVISSQLDNFVVVDVSGPEVRYDVRTFGGLTTGRYTPETWQAIYAYDQGTLRRKLFRRWSSPERMLDGVLQVGAVSFGAGVVATLALLTLSRARRRAA